MSDDSAYAAAPFDHPKADIILRSSDNIDFRVFKLFLSLASPFFETLFDIPQPAEEDGGQEVKDGLVVIPVTEDSKTLDTLLRFCYPCTMAEDPRLEVLKDVMDVLEAARKYSLDAIEKKARQAMASPKILEVEPLRCFAFAHRGRLREETLIAAKYTLTQSLIPSWFQELELINASDLLSLLTYHKKCGDAVYALGNDLSWITSHYGSAQACSWLAGVNPHEESRGAYSMSSRPCYEASSVTRNCTCASVNASNMKYEIFDVTLHWWDNFMQETLAALLDKPCKDTVQVFADRTVQVIKARNCPSCSPKVAEGMRDFVDLFARKVEEAVATVELELQF